MSKPRILLIDLENKSFGGQEAHIFALHKMLLSHGYSSQLLVTTNSPLAKKAQNEQIPVLQTSLTKIISVRFLFNFLFTRYLKIICKKERIHIIHCNNRPEISGARNAAHACNARVIFSRNVPDIFDANKIKNIDTFVSVDPKITTYFEQENRRKDLGVKHFSTLPPLFNADKFLTYSPTASQEPKGLYPVICMIGNMVPDVQHKNHPLLFQAVHQLIYKKNTPVQVILAGDGPKRQDLEALAKKLAIQNYVTFLGFTETTADILFNADIFVLASSKEAFGIVYLEAGLMKKPSIGALGTGAEQIIVPEKTGLLFKNNDVNDLAEQLKRLIDHPEFARQLGENAYEHVLRNFAPEVIFKKYEELYKKIANN